MTRLGPFFAILLLLVAVPCTANILHIPDNYDTIYDAWLDTEEEDTILVHPGTYSYDFNALEWYGFNHVWIGSEFLLDNDPTHIEETILTSRSSVLELSGFADSTLTISGITITGGAGHAYIHEHTGIRDGGGIYCYDAGVIFDHVTITGNSANGGESGGYGGGVYCVGGSPTFHNCEISNNVAGGMGGGMYFYNSSPFLSGVTVTGNTGVGIALLGGEPVFDPDNRCSVYLNNNQPGMDIYSTTAIEVYLDTATVPEPDGYYLYPVENFTVNVNTGYFETVNADLYVNTNDGDNSYSGLDPDHALETIDVAMHMITADSTNPRTIYLSPGRYQPSEDHNPFPVFVKDHVSIQGTSESGGTVLESWESSLFVYESVHDVSVSDLVMMGGTSDKSGAFLFLNSSASLRNITILSAEGMGIFPNLNQGLGGAIGIISSVVHMENMNFTLCRGIYGGAVYAGGNSDVTIDRCFFDGNHTEFPGSMEDVGGAIDVGGSASVVITNSTFIRNHAQRGSAIHSWGGEVVILNSILWDNGALPCYFRHGTDAVIAFSDLEGGLDSVYVQGDVNITWDETVIDEDPLFVDPEEQDWELSDESPCIDTGIALYVHDGDTLVNIPLEDYWGLAPDMGKWESNVNSDAEELITVPETFDLQLTAYPNPFNPSITVSFVAPSPGTVRLEVFDILGRRVRVLVDGVVSTGQHCFVWDGQDTRGIDVASGTYFIRLRAPEYSLTRRSVLVR